MQRAKPELNFTFMVSILTAWWMSSRTSCIEDNKVLSAQGFRHVPKNLSANLVTLDLSNNNITIIERDDFLTLKRVNTINLSYNQIQTLDERSFEHVCCLEELDLSYNNIVHLPHCIFSNNKNLKKLYLKKNRLQVIGDSSKAEHILDSQSLTYLDVSFCNFTYISIEALKGLSNLKTIIIKGNPLKQLNLENKTPPENPKTMKTYFCNSSTFEKSCCGLQEQGVEIISSTLSSPTIQTDANGTVWVDPVVLIVGTIMWAVVFIIVVTWYFLITCRTCRRANEVAIEKRNSVDAIQKRPLPRPPLQDVGYEVPITPSSECNSSVPSKNLQLNRNCGYFPVPSAENDSNITRDNSTCQVLKAINYGSAQSLTGPTQNQDKVCHSPNIYIFKCSDVSEEEEEEENDLPVPPMKGKSSIPTSPHLSGENRQTFTGMPLRLFQKFGCPQDGGHFKKKKAPARPTPTSQASPTINVTNFSVKKINSENVFVSSTVIELGQDS